MSQRLITDVLLERYLAGDVDAALRAEIDGKLAASASDRERLDELQRDSAAFLVARVALSREPRDRIRARLTSARVIRA